MKNLIKSLVFLFTFFLVSQANAQFSAGPGIVYGTGIDNIGFTLNGKYQINETWSAAPTFTYFLKKNYVNWSALDLDANYLLTEVENIGSLYAIGGLNMTFFKVKYDYDLGEWGGNISDSYTGSDVGINIGAGLNIAISEKINLAPEARYTFGGANYFRIGAKLMVNL